jgi:hypothetical protein
MSFHLLICHYGDLFWTENAIALWSKLKISAITVSFPSDSIETRQLDKLRALWQEAIGSETSLTLQILQEPSLRHASLDHAQSISELRRTTEFTTSHVVVADPDLWIIRPEMFLSEISRMGYEDALFVADHLATNLSHACLAIMPKDFFLGLEFPQELENLSVDFARGWHGLHRKEYPLAPIARLHQPIQVKRWGLYFYPQIGAVHFSGQSFVGSKWIQPSFRPWVNWASGAPKRFARFMLGRLHFLQNRATYFGGAPGTTFIKAK